MSIQIHSIAYISQANAGVSPKELQLLANKCKIKNLQRSITGCLSYLDYHFFEYLEGPENEIKTLLQDITEDYRHTIIHHVTLPAMTERLFPTWNMTLLNKSKLEQLHLETLFIKVMIECKSNNTPELTRSVMQFVQQIHHFRKAISNQKLAS